MFFLSKIFKSKKGKILSTITINGKKYNEKDLSVESKTQLVSVKLCESEITRLENLIAMNKTARNACVVSLSSNLPKKTAAANRKNGILTIDDKKYLVEDLNDKAKNSFFLISSIDKKIKELNTELAIATTAKNTYNKILIDSL